MKQTHAKTIHDLLDIMSQLRDPEHGCEWDKQQTYQSIIPYTIEEAYEVADAIEQKDLTGLKYELGDLLFQVVFYSQIAKEDDAFTFHDVVEAICAKLVERHPHVFSDATYSCPEELHRAWENQKHKERQQKDEHASLLDDIPKALPALKRSQKIQKRVAKQGFDWPEIDGVWAKINEETMEVKQAAEDGNSEEIAEELGDLSFALVNLIRKYGFDAETILSKANAKFEIRFRKMEKLIQSDQLMMSQLNLETLECYWSKAKEAHKKFSEKS